MAYLRKKSYRSRVGSILILCVTILKVHGATADVKCDRSLSRLESGVDVRVCVRALSPTSLEITWSRDRVSSTADSGQVKHWIVTVAASYDRRRVVSFVSLRSTVARHVVRMLTPGTEYFVFLDSVDYNDWYLTMIPRPIAVRTMSAEETKTTVKSTERAGGREPSIGHGRDGYQRTTTSQTIVSKAEEEKDEWTRRRGGKPKRTEGELQTTPEVIYGSKRRGSRKINRTTAIPFKSTSDGADGGRRRGSSRRETWTAWVPGGEEREIRTERIDERKRVINRKTLATQLPRKATKPKIEKTNHSNIRTTPAESERVKTFPGEARSKATVAHTSTFVPMEGSMKEKSGNNSDAENTKKQTEARDYNDAGSRVLWWVLITSVSGGVLFLALTMITAWTNRCRRRCKPLSCPHIEHEISQTSRSSSKLNNGGSATNAQNPDSTNNKPRTIAQNSYTRTPSSLQSRPLPRVLVNSPATSASDNIGATCGFGRRNPEGHKLAGYQLEESIYATVGDDLLTPDPARVVSIISWGSEFDILEESKGAMYSNLTAENRPDNEYGNLEMTYCNLLSISMSSPPHRIDTTQPTPSSGLVSAAAAAPSSTNIDKLPSQHPYAVPRRQISTSSIPNFLAPPPPSSSPNTLSKLFPHSQTSQHPASALPQQQQTAPMPGLDLPKEQLQKLVMLLLSKPTESVAGETMPTSPGTSNTNCTGSTDQPTSPTYLVPANCSLGKHNIHPFH
ncbi:hypothetical protein RRG08_050745 [Elysia crispata]|uniref:Fibronectin type-III domain-containing protein n=1 Tax=Elysia crispata TaxID=231223 RepID=A0AAE1DLW6_9GAST|nr:hypothetical protein RRG08_050745 [Elysia crispata]